MTEKSNPTSLSELEVATNEVLGELSEPQAMTVKKYIDALKEAGALEFKELQARMAFDGLVKNKFGFAASKFQFEHFIVAYQKDGAWVSYCELCGEEATKVKDDQGRTTCEEFTCKSDCPGVVLGYWERENTRI